MKLPKYVCYRLHEHKLSVELEQVPSEEVEDALDRNVPLPPDDTDGLVLKCAGCSSTLGRKWKIFGRERASDRELPAFCPVCGQRVYRAEE